MVLELGPCPTEEAQSWIRFSRRILIELRADCGAPGLPDQDVVGCWSRMIESWYARNELAASKGEAFRLTEEYDAEYAQYLLHGLEQCILSSRVAEWITTEEAAEQVSFTLHVVQAFVDGLATEDESAVHYVEQIKAAFGSQLN